MSRYSLRCCLAALLLAACGWSGTGPVAAAEAPFGVSLLARDSLVGWTYGPTPPSGWTVKEGRLTAGRESSPLVSGWSLGDFELRARGKAESGAVVELRFHPTPKGETEVLKLPASQDSDEHSLTVERHGAQLKVRLDDRELATLTVPADARFVPGLAVTDGGCELWDLRLREPAGDPLWNGKDLDGWWTPGKLASWVADKGSLVCLNKQGNYLRSQREFGNFTLALEYKMKKGGNSGIGIRTPKNGWPSQNGMELQLYDQPPQAELDVHSALSIYGHVKPLIRADKSNDWNHLVIKADGRMVTAWSNGVLCQHANTAQVDGLKDRPLRGWVGFQDHGSRIEFRNVQLLAAPEGLGLDAWYAAGK